MPVSARSIPKIRKAIQDDISALNAGYDVLSGPIKDLCVNPEATQLNYLEGQISYASKLLSLDNASELDPVDVDAFGGNFGLKRGLGTYAHGQVLFERTSAPTSDLAIPAGSIVYLTGTSKAYTTDKSVTMYASLAPTYYNAYRGRWGVVAQITASNQGTDYNTAAGTIQTLGSTISGINSCYNPSDVTGGVDLATNTEYANSLKMVLGGSDRSSPGGCIAEVVKTFPGLLSVSVLQGSDALITRMATGVPRDICISGFVGTQTSQGFTVTASGGQIFSSQPVLQILGVFNQTTGALYSSGSDYTLEKDTGAESGSIYAEDSLYIPSGSNIPGQTITVVYTYNQSVVDLQAFYDTPKNTILGTDIMAREGKAVPIYLGIQMSALPGYDYSTLQDSVSEYLLNELNTGVFGDDETALTPDSVRLLVLNSIGGISSFLFTMFSKSNTVGDIETIILARNEYLVFDTTTLQWVS